MREGGKWGRETQRERKGEERREGKKAAEQGRRKHIHERRLWFCDLQECWHKILSCVLVAARVITSGIREVVSGDQHAE